MKILFALLLLILTLNVQAQQDPLYAQYFNNPILINPAYAGHADRMILSVGYRTQWNGIDGGPQTFNFNGHTSFADNKVGAGIVLAQDQIGEYKTTQYGGVFSYKIKLPYSTLSFGINAGFVQYSTSSTDLNVQNPDPLFVPFSTTQFNTGFGMLLKNERYSVGLSVPQMISNSYDREIQDVQLSSANYYLYGGYLFFLTERVEFKPSTLLRYTKDTSPSVDVNINFSLDRLYTAGIFTRNLNTYGILVQGIFKNARLGYIFEIPGKSSALRFNTHELSLAISLGVLKGHSHTEMGL